MKIFKTNRLIITTLLATTLNIVLAQSDTSNVYVFLYELPDAGIYLPAPPDTASLVYADDIIQWQWGKEQRNTPRGALANYDGKWGA